MSLILRKNVDENISVILQLMSVFMYEYWNDKQNYLLQVALNRSKLPAIANELTSHLYNNLLVKIKKFSKPQKTNIFSTVTLFPMN